MSIYREFKEVCVDADDTFTLTQKWDKYMEVHIGNLGDAIEVRDLLDNYIKDQERK